MISCVYTKTSSRKVVRVKGIMTFFDFFFFALRARTQTHTETEPKIWNLRMAGIYIFEAGERGVEISKLRLITTSTIANSTPVSTLIEQSL